MQDALAHVDVAFFKITADAGNVDRDLALGELLILNLNVALDVLGAARGGLGTRGQLLVEGVASLRSVVAGSPYHVPGAVHSHAGRLATCGNVGGSQASVAKVIRHQRPESHQHTDNHANYGESDDSLTHAL